MKYEREQIKCEKDGLNGEWFEPDSDKELLRADKAVANMNKITGAKDDISILNAKAKVANIEAADVKDSNAKDAYAKDANDKVANITVDTDKNVANQFKKLLKTIKIESREVAPINHV